MKIRNAYIYALAAVIAATGLIPAGCSKGEKKNESGISATAVQVIKPEFRDSREILTFPGYTQPPVITYASFLIPGKIKNLNLEVGKPVRKGQVIAEIDASIYEKQLGAAQASAGVAEANLARVNAGARDQEKEMAKGQMMQAKHNFELARTEKDRFESLYKIDAIPKRQYDTVINQYNLAKDQLRIAEEKYNLVKEGASREEKQIAGANVGVARANVAQAETQLGFGTLVSPVDGVIAEKKAEVGVVVAAGTPIYEIRSNSSMDMVVYVPSVHIEKIYSGLKAKVTFIENEGKPIEGTVREIKPASDMPTRSYRVKIRIPKTPQLKSYSGVIGKATFEFGTSRRGVSVPVACLKNGTEDKAYYVFTVNSSNEAEKIPVKLIRFQDDKALIDAKIDKNAKVVLSGQDYLKQGAKVRIVNALDSEEYVSPDKDNAPPNPDARI